jgi:hypothetical protein
MTEAQSKAWNCLREDEKQSLFLQMSSGKSTWEAGTIMGRSHYKYIEIRERSQKFFKMFTEFFEKHESIFRPGCPCSQLFRDYIEAVIERRVTRRQAIVKTGSSVHVAFKNIRTPMLELNINKLRISEDPWDIDTMNLIVEFDRWNNFRVLPKRMQAPSAYRRRSNGKYKLYLSYMLDRFPKWLQRKIQERFKAPRSKSVYYIAIFSKEKFKDNFGYKVLAIQKTEEAIREMSRFMIYVFDDKELADSFGFLVSQFRDRTCNIKTGQYFWREYREVIEKAINYNMVSNISFNLKTLDEAYKKPKRQRKSQNEDGVKGQERLQEDVIYQ